MRGRVIDEKLIHDYGPGDGQPDPGKYKAEPCLFAHKNVATGRSSSDLSESLRPLCLCVYLSSLFPYILTSLLLYFVLSLPRHRRFRRFVVFRLRHPLVIRRRLLQQFLPRFHLRVHAHLIGSPRIVRISTAICRGGAFARHSPLVTRHFPRRRPDARLIRQPILRRRKSFIAPQRLPRQRLKLLQARQLLQIAQPEPHQELFRCLIQNRPPHHFLPSRRGNQVFVQQRADHPRSVHPANLRNLRRSHRLLVSNHRQSLQRRHRKPQRWPQALDKPPHHIMLLWFCIKFVPARHRPNLDPPRFRRIAGHQLIQRSLHRQLLLPQRLSQLLDRSWLIRRINNRFQRRFSLFVSHACLIWTAAA